MSATALRKLPQIRTRVLKGSNEKGVSGWGFKLIPICTSIKFNFIYSPYHLYLHIIRSSAGLFREG